MSATASSFVVPPPGSSIDSRRSASMSLANGLVEPHQQVERPLAVEHLGDDLAVHRRFDQTR